MSEDCEQDVPVESATRCKVDICQQLQIGVIS